MSIVIPRSVWQPRYSNGATDSQGRPIIIGTSAWEAANREIWVHHSTTNPPGPDATLEQDCAHMRVFEQIGQDRFGQGISYTWVVMPSGRVFEGHSIDRRGAHTYQRNDRSRAICLAGNFDVRDLPDRMVRSAALLLAELQAEADGGHRDVYATACPGRYAYARIPEINRLSVAHRRGEIDLGEEDDVQLTDKVELFNHDTGENQDYTLQDTLFGIHLHAKESDIKIARVEAKLDALTGALSNDEAAIVAAVRAQTGGQVDVPQLAAALAPLLSGINQKDIERALANVLRSGTNGVSTD